MRATKVNAGLAESSGRLLLDIWRDSLHVTCGLTACTPGSAPGPTLGNEYGKTLPLPYLSLARVPSHIADWDRLQDARTVLLIWNLSRFCLFLCRNTVEFTSATYGPLYSRPSGAVVQRVSVFLDHIV